jgi:hypothetical protein
MEIGEEQGERNVGEMFDLKKEEKLKTKYTKGVRTNKEEKE